MSPFISEEIGTCPRLFPRRFRTLCVVDDFTREALAIVVDTSLSGVRVGRELDRIIARRGRPAMIVSDNGTELTSHAILRWQKERKKRGHAPQKTGTRTI